MPFVGNKAAAKKDLSLVRLSRSLTYCMIPICRSYGTLNTIAFICYQPFAFKRA